MVCQIEHFHCYLISTKSLSRFMFWAYTVKSVSTEFYSRAMGIRGGKTVKGYDKFLFPVLDYSSELECMAMYIGISFLMF